MPDQEQARFRTIKTIAQAVRLADDWRAHAEFWQRRAELQQAENERLRIFLKAADTLLAE